MKRSAKKRVLRERELALLDPVQTEYLYVARSRNIAARSSDDVPVTENFIGQLVEWCMKHHGCSQPVFEFQRTSVENSLVFVCTCIVTVAGQRYESTGNSCVHKAAKQLAAQQILHCVREKVDVREITAAKLEAVYAQKSYINKLEELCATNDRWSSPRFYVHPSGPPHQPLYTCSCTVKTRHGIIEFTGNASRKHLAMHLAAEKMYNQLSSEQPDAPLPQPHTNTVEVEHVAVDKNFVAILRELSGQHKEWFAPSYEYHRMTIEDQLVIRCICTIATAQGAVSTHGTAWTRSIAQQVAAKKMLDRFDTRERDSADYQQALLDTCRRNGWSEPSFRFEEWGDSHKPIYTCTASLVIHRQQHSAIGIGATKRTAKSVATRELLRTLSHIT